jgi:hypothetical protein
LENKRVEQVLPEAGVVGLLRGKVAQIIYNHVSKCENDEIK